MLIESLFRKVITFFVLMDPIGNIPIFLAVLKGIPLKRTPWITFRELLIALLFIIGFFFIGEWVMNWIGVKEYTLRISGGIILFLIAIKMIFSEPEAKKTEEAQSEPFIVPLAIPLVAGPAILSAVMISDHESSSNWMTLFAIIIAWSLSTLILLSASFLKKILGEKGLGAAERLMGLLLVLISIQMFLEGIQSFSSLCQK